MPINNAMKCEKTSIMVEIRSIQRNVDVWRIDLCGVPGSLVVYSLIYLTKSNFVDFSIWPVRCGEEGRPIGTAKEERVAYQ